MDGSGTVTEVIFYCFSDTHMSVYTIYLKQKKNTHNLASLNSRKNIKWKIIIKDEKFDHISESSSDCFAREGLINYLRPRVSLQIPFISKF